MVREAFNAYLSLASGITEATRQRAMAAAQALVQQGEATVEQMAQLAEELVETSRSNRDALTHLVRGEVDRALGTVGLASIDEVNALTLRVRELEAALRAAEQRGGTASATPAAKKTTATKSTAKKTTATKSAATKSAATKSAATKSAGKKSTAKKTTAGGGSGS